MDSDMRCPNCGGLLFIVQRTKVHCVRCHQIIESCDISKVISAQDQQEDAA